VRFELPDVDWLPLQSPLAVQLVALVDDQLSVELPLKATEVGLAVNISVGAGGDPTVTLAVCEIDPPAPWHVSVYAALAVKLLLVALPEVDCAPLQLPLAVQLVAFVDDQLSVVLPLKATDAGLAVSVSVGAGGAPTVTVADFAIEPPAPWQVSVYVLFAVRLVRFELPDVG